MSHRLSTTDEYRVTSNYEPREWSWAKVKYSPHYSVTPGAVAGESLGRTTPPLCMPRRVKCPPVSLTNRRHNKPALGPIGDKLDDLAAE